MYSSTASAGVDAEIPDGDGRRHGAANPPRERSGSGDAHRKRERFGEEVVSTGIKRLGFAEVAVNPLGEGSGETRR